MNTRRCELGTSHTSSPCRRCIEAFVAGKRVYCGADGSFHPLYGNPIRCNAFSSRPELAALTTDLTEKEAGRERTAVCERPVNGKQDVN